MMTGSRLQHSRSNFKLNVGVKADEDELNSIIAKNPYDVFVLTPSVNSVTYSEFLELRKDKMRNDRVPEEKIDAKPHLNIIAVDSTWGQVLIPSPLL